MSDDLDRPFRFADRPDRVTVGDLRSRRYRRLFRGVHVAAAIPITLAVRAQGALLLGGEDAYVSHHTAAALWGGVTPDDAASMSRVRPGHGSPASRRIGRAPTSQ